MRRRQRGYIMVVVLLCLAAVSLTGALVMTQSEDQLVTTVALRNQGIASARASLGAQRALAELRMPTPPTYLASLETLQPCKSYQECVAACPNGISEGCTRFVTMPKVDKGRSQQKNLTEGGGSIYFVQFYKEQKESEAPITVIISTGYYGYDPTVVPGATRFESMVRVEVGGTPVASDTCVGYCGGGL